MNRIIQHYNKGLYNILKPHGQNSMSVIGHNFVRITSTVGIWSSVIIN